MSHGIVPERLAQGTRGTIAPIARALVAMGISANTVTIVGGAITFLGAVLLALGLPLAALVVLAIGTLADTLDGQLAKAAGGGTPFGAFLDSTVDRISDGVLFAGAAAVGASLGQPILFWSALVALVASFLVPYVRAKAEALGVSANIGPAPREARIVIFLLGLATWAFFDVQALFAAAVLAVAILSTITFALRVVHVGRELSTKGR